MRAASVRGLEVHGAGLHRGPVARHPLTGNRHAHAGAEVELPAVQRAGDDVTVDPAVAEIATLMRALVGNSEDLGITAGGLHGTAIEEDIGAVDGHQHGREQRQLGEVHHLGLHRYAWSSSSTMWSTCTGLPPWPSPCAIWMMQPGFAVTTASAPVARMFWTLRSCSRVAISGWVRL